MNEKKWNAVRQFYMDSFGISPELVDLMASNEVLLMCVSGSSNESISVILNIDMGDVREILDTILNFSGWETDLEYSPFKIYEEDNEYISFVGSIVEINFASKGNPELDIDEINTMYFNCKTYASIEERLSVGWQ